MKRNRFFIFSCFIVFLTTVISCQPKDQEPVISNPQSNETKSSENKTRNNKPALDTNITVLTATELTEEYVANEIKADHDYKGKQIIVSGIITDIKRGIGDDIYIILQGIEKSRSVQCYYDNETEAQSLKKGQKIFFRGRCDGLWVNVILSDCERVGEFIN